MSTRNHVTAYESLEKFKEAHHDLDSVAKILAQYPLEGGEEDFIHDYEGELKGGSREARKIYRIAANIQEKATLIWANINDVTSPHYNQALFNNLPKEFICQIQSIPGYDRLFRSLDHVECDHCRSIFGPAAYFVDLMRFVETNITSVKIPTECTLKNRRPDLYNMQLNCSNANDLIPYIDLVNELLEVFIKTTENANQDAYELTKDAIFPMHLPFNLPLEEIRSYLKRSEINLYNIYEAFKDQKESDTRCLIAREFLELSPKEFDLVISEISSPSDISKYYGDLPLRGKDGLENVDLFLEQTKLTRQELNLLIFQDLDRHEINAGLSRLFFINNVDDGLGALRISQEENDDYEKLVNLSSRKLDRIYRFVKLSRKLGWSFAELDWSLRSVQESYIPEKIMRFDGINDYVACQNVENLDLTTFQEFTIEAWVNPTRPGTNPVIGALMCDGNRQFHLFFGVDTSNKLIFRVREGSGEDLEFKTVIELKSDYLIPLGAFTHLAVVVGNHIARLYINGKRDNKASLEINNKPDDEANFETPIDLTSPTQVNLNIGKDLYDEYFDGCITDLRIWRCARDQAAIEDSRYLRLTGRERGLVGYWPLTENQRNKLTDLTPNGNDGIMGGEEFVTQPRWVRRDLILDPLPERGDGKGYQFNGIDQYLATRVVSYDEINQMTLEAWIKTENNQDNYIICMGDNTQNPKFALWVDNEKKLNFSIGATELYKSDQDIISQQLTHVCIVLKDDTLDLYIDGKPDKKFSLSSPLNFVLWEHNLNVGKNVDGKYFKGVIKELRLWNKARTDDQIDLYMYRPVPSGEAGLIGRWPLDEVEDGIAKDLSYNQNHLYLGGVPEDYTPKRKTTVRLPAPESFPIPLNGTALQFDGDNDVIVIRNRNNWGLGKYERLTLELWFNASDENRSDHNQVIFSQGDTEAGLNIYLRDDQLHILEWKNNYEGTLLQQSVFRSGPIEYARWHHIAVTNDEFPTPSPVLPDKVKFRAYLDGKGLKTENDSEILDGDALEKEDLEVAEGYRLSPVGPAYLGGLGQGGIARFEDAYSEPGSEHLYFFAGKVADLRLWKTVKTADEIEYDRRFAPTIAEDLVAYFPLDEGKGWLVRDLAGEQHNNQHKGTLQKRNIALVTDRADHQLVNIYSHYADPEALKWKDYVYAGRMRVTEKASAVGITFLSRHPDNVDQYYRLGRDEANPTFHLVAHPLGVQAVHGKIDSKVNPDADNWYRFLIQVEDDGSRTNIRAKVWLETEEEPAEFQIDAYDRSEIRIISGTVGVWTSGASEGSRQFDNLRVWPVSIPDPKPFDLLLDINFEALSEMPEPEKWRDTGDRLEPVADEGLFGRIEVDGSKDIAFGIDSTDENVHSHYSPTDVDANVLRWRDYVYQGKMRISDPEGGIGVTFLSRYPEGIDQYYALRRDPQDRTFHLVAHPSGVQSIKSSDPITDKTDSAVEPEPNTWYRFLVEVKDAGSRTEVRAKVWPENVREPAEFQIEAHDESGIRITSGTVGVWASDAGSKYFDDLRVYREVLFSDNFDAYSLNRDPESWRDTKAGYSNEEDDALFKTFEIEGDKVFGTESIKNFVHSHYIGADARDWDSYIYTGKMRITDLGGGIGVTFFSQYFKDAENYKQYYWLGYNPYGPSDDPSDPMMHNFYLSPHPPYGMLPIKGRYISEVGPESDTWYRFLIEVERTGTQTNIRAKIWPESEAEPSEYQIEAYDDGSDRPAGGTVGVWAYGRGSKYFDDLNVVGEVLLSEMFGPGNWSEVGSRNRHEEDVSLFRTVDILNNNPRWTPIEDDYPVLLRPLSQTALHFDGQREYLATEADGLELSQITAEAWVFLSEIKECPILSLRGDLDRSPTALVFGIDGLGRLKLTKLAWNDDKKSLVPGPESAVGTVSVDVKKFVHVAFGLEKGNVTFFVNGKSEEITLSQFYPLSLKINSLEIGRNFDAQYFEGEIKEVRIWKTARSSEEISSWIYQRPFASDDLVGRWSLGEDYGDIAEDASINKNPMRLGGLESARRPVLIDLDSPEKDFWRSERKVLDFNGTSHIVSFNDDSKEAICQRRAVEVWFWVEDKTISHLKQVIYQEGDDERGLNIYVYDGSLYLGGYNIHESQWEGTWLHTDRIESCRWHHAALVLDGRGEVRDESLQGFLDGKLIDVGPGSQLWEQKSSFRLGGVRGQVRFHDGVAGISSGHHFRGQILDVRVWSSIRTIEQIQKSVCILPTDGHSPKDEPGIFLWWQFDDAANCTIPDLSGNNRVATFATGQLKPIQLPPDYKLPSVLLNASALNEIASIKRLKERHRWSIDRLCALWHSIKHFGKDDQAVLFDQIFNTEGGVIERWDYYLDQTIRWDKTGQEDRVRDRKIRSRLMGALRVSDDDLNAIVERLSGEDEKIIELDNLYLTRMYRLAQLSGMLHLKVRDLLQLLSLADKSSADSLQDVMELEELARWMKSAGLGVDDLVFVTHDPDDLEGSVSFFKEADVLDTADDLIDQAKSILIKRDSFRGEQISQTESVDIFDFLRDKGLISEIGAVTPNYSMTVDFTDLLEGLAKKHNWIREFDPVKFEFDQIELKLGNEIIERLKEHEFIDSNGYVLNKPDGYGQESLVVILEGASFSQDISAKILKKLPRVADILELRKTVQDQIVSEEGPVRTALQKTRDDQSNAFFSVLASLFDVQPDLTSVVLEHLRENGEMDASQLLYLLNNVQKSRYIPDTLAAYLAKLSKAFYLASLFGLAVPEVKALLEDPERFSQNDVLRPTLQELDNLLRFKQLQAAFKDTDGKLIHLLGLKACDIDAALKEIDDLTGWEPRQVKSLVRHLRHNQIRAAFDDTEGEFILLVCLKADDIDAALKEIDDLACWEPDEGDMAKLRAAVDDTDDNLMMIHLVCSKSDDVYAALKEIDDLACWEPLQITSVNNFDIFRYNRIADLSRMKACFDLAQSLQVDIDFLIQLADTSLLGTDGEFGFYFREATLLLEVLRAKYTDEEWPKVYKPIRDQLAVQRRDALLGLAMLKLKLDPEYEGRKDPDIFHKYFLLDFLVGSEVETSRIAQGIASLQLYVQRCLMNLEAGVDPSTIPTEEWEWIKNYRVWEANRKVFLYPENYIEPDLRDTKTPIFEELEQELLQSDITQESAEAAFSHYLEKFAEIADLKIVGSYLYTDVNDIERRSIPAARDEVLYLIGRTNTDPKIYYLREHVKDKMGERWLPWKKIDLVINSDFATPVYAFGKLFLFWTEFTKLTKSVDKKLSNEILGANEADALLKAAALSTAVEAFGNGFRIIPTIINKYYTIVEYKGGVFTDDVCLEFARLIDKINGSKLLYLKEFYPSYHEIKNNTIQFIFDIECAYCNILVHLFSEEYNDLLVELGDMNIMNLEEGKWKIEKEGYLFNTESGQRVQEMVYVYDSIVKYSYFNFSKGWIQPQNYVKLNNELTESMYKSPRWQRVYAQQVLELVPEKTGQPKQKYETDVKVLQIDEMTQLKKVIPKFDMSQMTWEFWTKFVTTTDLTEWPDSIKEEDLKKSVRLVDYDNGSFNVIATKKITITQAYEIAKAKLEDIKQRLEIKGRSNKLTEALDAAKEALKHTPKWESKAVTLKVQLWENKLEADLDRDIWQHIAIIFKNNNNGSSTATLYKHENGKEICLGSLTGKCLPKQKSLVIGNQEADVLGTYVAQMSEFRLWKQERAIDTIEKELNCRKTRGEVGLFYLPLNEIELPSRMNLVESEGLNFKLPILEGKLSDRIGKQREHIILFYGDQVASLRNNLKDKSFNLKLESKEQEERSYYDVNLSYYQDDQNTVPKAVLHLTRTNKLSIYDFATGEEGAVLARPAELSATDAVPEEHLLNNLDIAESSFADVYNQPGWYVVDVGDEFFLIKAEFSDRQRILTMPTMTEITKVNYDDPNNQYGSPVALSISYELKDKVEGNGDRPPALVVSDSTTTAFKFERLNTFAVHELSENLFTGGIDKLLSLESQQAEELDFQKEYEPYNKSENKSEPDLFPLISNLNSISNAIDFRGAYGLYFEEIFFHIPFLIANKLNSNQNFSDSQRWYHYIFNPTSSGIDGDLDRYWRYLPFRCRNLERLFDLLTDGTALSAYREDPFDPHAIAALRLNSYQKAVVMKYIDNLLDWGDSLFMQSTGESITEALMLYILAYDLLGPRPKSKTIKRFEEMGTYEEFIREYEGCELDEVPEFFTEVEKQNSTCATPVPHSNIITDFCVPENAKFIGYWDRVEDRLFKIRHSLNIEGVFRQLALFEPPIEPMELVRAIAGGASISGALSALNVPVPHYRYSFMLGTAKDMTSNVMELGSALLGAIESRDAEKLVLLQNTHERAILNLTTCIKEKEIDLAQGAIEALEISKKSADARLKRYEGLIAEDLNPQEIAELTLLVSAQVTKSTAYVLKIIEGFAGTIPNTKAGTVAPFPLMVTELGPKQFSAPFHTAILIAEHVADVLNMIAGITGKSAGYKRRRAEWEHEKELAGYDLEEIDQQIVGAKIQLAIAQQELAVHSKTIQQNQEIEQFYRSKFSNEALYSWMIGRLSGLYFQAYKLAYDMAKSAEKALQYELPTNETYIAPGHWDSLKKGLLAGESLMLELNRMEKSHLDQDSRFQEIEKTISMNRTFPGSLLLLVASGECEFRLSEELFDRDYPGHYFRVIKSIEIEVKTSRSMQPYESLNATLIQLGNKTLIDPDLSGVSYLLGLGSEQPTSNTLRVNWRANQQVAISRVNEKDDGMFVLNFFLDDRYFPFEGTGAVSSWRLEIPKANNPDLVKDDILEIEDVLIHLRYTAKSDRGSFKAEVENLLQQELEEA